MVNRATKPKVTGSPVGRATNPLVIGMFCELAQLPATGRAPITPTCVAAKKKTSGAAPWAEAR